MMPLILAACLTANQITVIDRRAECKYICVGEVSDAEAKDTRYDPKEDECICAVRVRRADALAPQLKLPQRIRKTPDFKAPEEPQEPAPSYYRFSPTLDFDSDF